MSAKSMRCLAKLRARPCYSALGVALHLKETADTPSSSFVEVNSRYSEIPTLLAYPVGVSCSTTGYAVFFPATVVIEHMDLL